MSARLTAGWRLAGAVAAGLLAASRADAPDKVGVGIYGVFLQMDPATSEILGQTYRTEISSVPQAPPNCELMPLLSHEPFTHGGYLRLTEPTATEPITLPFGLDIPQFTDQNGNGLHDFFEAVAGVEAQTSQGAYLDPVSGERPLHATWSRAAGSVEGVCQLRFAPLGLEFAHAFRLSEFHGTIAYTNPPTRQFTGWLEATTLPASAGALEGAVEIVRLGDEALDVADGALTNATAQALPFRLEQPLQRAGTNYLGFLVFADGQPATPEPDYVDFVMVISDDRDANANGLPDISEPLRPDPARLRVSTHGDSVRLTIEGTVGFVYSIETTTVLGSSWVEETAVFMKHPQETVPLAVPWSGGYWRAVAE